MKALLKILCSTVILLCSANLFGQTEEASVKKVLASYKAGIEALSTEGLSDLFMKESQVFESGGVEGTFEHYLDHHLGPELKEFNSFKFSDHEISVVVNLPYAFTTETYFFRIELAEDGKVVERKGVATSVLIKTDGQWKILKTHSSSRAKK
ncbi:MAG: nuclear transport factor 2 family protein [Cyclobacteriaceae bacterium]